MLLNSPPSQTGPGHPQRFDVHGFVHVAAIYVGTLQTEGWRATTHGGGGIISTNGRLHHSLLTASPEGLSQLSRQVLKVPGKSTSSSSRAPSLHIRVTAVAGPSLIHSVGRIIGQLQGVGGPLQGAQRASLRISLLQSLHMPSHLQLPSCLSICPSDPGTGPARSVTGRAAGRWARCLIAYLFRVEDGCLDAVQS